MERMVITVSQKPGEGDLSGSTGLVIQAAINEAARLGGGEVLLGEGVYTLQSAISLKSGVSLRGQCGKTVLRLAPQRMATIARDADLHQAEVTVTDAAPFRPGQSVFLSRPDWLYGFFDTVAYVTGIRGNVVELDREISYTHEAAWGTRLVTGGSLLWGDGVEDVAIDGLILDGNKEENPVVTGGCVAGGLYLFRAKNVQLTDVVVRDYNGDGFSYQHCQHVDLTRCQAIGCTQLGIHPGSGTTGTNIIDCIAEHNGKDGIFFCWRVTQGLVDGCRSRYNGMAGLSIGHKDEGNIIRNSEFSFNRQCGMFWRNEPAGSTADYVVAQNNRIQDNGGAPGHGYTGIRVRGVTGHLQLVGNHIAFTDPAISKLSVGIVLEKDTHDITLADNVFEGCAQEVAPRYPTGDEQ
nr:right-handed parallel beta-helix repeat-containing protein [bacterium]